MRNHFLPVTFQISVAFDSFTSTAPARMIDTFKKSFPRSFHIDYRERPYPRRIVVSGVPIESVSSVHGALLVLMEEYVDEAKGISIQQEQGEIRKQ